MSRYVAVGTGTVVPEGDRGMSAHYLEVGGRRVLLDCGPGTVQGLVRHGLPWEELTDVCLSHFHPDHVGALPGLLFSLKHAAGSAREGRELTVRGPVGTVRLFDRLASALGDYVLDPGFPVTIREEEPGTEEELGGGLRLRTHGTPHTDESRALRLDGGGAAVGYTGDTGPEPGLESFFGGVGLLVAECSLTDEEVGDNHLSPPRVARLARGVRPELLALTHIYPHVRSNHDVPALVRAAGWTGEVRVARDGWEHHLRANTNARS